ncbi:paramyosin-like [Dreissena polymorpha]|uniref:paramyosin-like n=1 Tax=Dreissena polymorpha TaxID=45954 RepID=UPI00226472E5|nr:paramyosin-like [Dreissena polymorpha]
MAKKDFEIKKLKELLSKERENSRKYQLACDELLEWKKECEEREKSRAKVYNAELATYVSIHINIKQQVQSLRDVATKREELINYLQRKKKDVCNDNESTELLKTEKKLQELKEELRHTTQKLRLEKEGRKEDNIKHKKDIEAVCNKFQVEIEAAVMSISMKLIKTQDDFTFKENELLDKISKAETKIQKLNNISNKYQETRHELETTNQQHEEYIKSMNEREQSIEQLQEEISAIQNDNRNLKKTVKELISNLAIASEENIKLQEETESWKQQLEIVKVHANTDVVKKERQLEFRIEEQRNGHLEEVKQIHLKYKDSMKLISDANSRERRAVDSVKVLEGKLKSLEDTISDMKDEYEQQKQELFKNVSVSLNTIKDLQTRLNNAQASERNLNKRLKERDQELERLNAFSKGQDSERRRFEAKIAANENQLQQANEQLEHFNKERQNLKQELYQEKSRLEELVKNYEASVNDRIKSKDDDSLLCQLDQLKSKEKELATEIIQVHQQLKSSNIELEETETRLSKLMGQRLTDNNPNITDLSDKNRPTKLAERYSELYDNEWADAFEDLNAIYNDEQKTIAMLTVILKEAACFCRNEADEQMEHLRKVLTLQTTLSVSRGQNVPDVINQQLKNSRKVMSEIAGTNIVETYIKRLKHLTSASARDALRVEKFLREAFSLCWLMSIQDPPVVFDRLQKHGEEFNAELYRPYTQAGALVDFQVLPTMFLNEGGPVLYKGVAQGYSLTNE